MLLSVSHAMEGNGMEEEEKIPRRIFTPEQKFEIVQDIERHSTVKEGFLN